MKGGRAVMFLATWYIAEVMREEPLGGPEASFTEAMRQHATYWEQSERTSFRDLLAFRACFPGEEDPRRIVGELHKRVELQQQVKAEKGSVARATAAIGLVAVAT
jgi:hypothetical protein